MCSVKGRRAPHPSFSCHLAGDMRLKEKEKLEGTEGQALVSFIHSCPRCLGSAKEFGISVGRSEGRLSRAYAKASRKRERHSRRQEEHTLSYGWGMKMIQTRGWSAGAKDAFVGAGV